MARTTRLAPLLHRPIVRAFAAAIAAFTITSLALTALPLSAQAAPEDPATTSSPTDSPDPSDTPTDPPAEDPTPPPVDDTPTSWGPDGTTTSDSSVTVRWDNEKNPPEDVVPRTADQVIPHTGGSTYADINQKTRDGYASLFGADNGRGGLEFTVSQTADLVNQSVTVSFKGAEGDPPNDGSSSIPTWFEVFQCWGAIGADSKPDPDASAPDPESCQGGVGGADTTTPNFGSTRGDRLGAKGDLANKSMPFRALDGTLVTNRSTTALFSRTTTNELSRLAVGPGGKGSRPFELQTGAESSALGCGFRDDAVSTPTCWIVAVPISKEFAESAGVQGTTPSGLSPSLWAQRLQVKLHFQDVAAKCPSGQAQTLSGGSELLSSSMASWIPGICQSTGVALGFSQLSDYQARQQLTGGSAKLAFGSQPVSGATGLVYSPTAVSGLAIAVNFDYQPCGLGGTAEQAQQACGYPDVASAQKELDRARQPITSLKLNARLIAKLLTQSYGAWSTRLGNSTVASQDPLGHEREGRAPWVGDLPPSLGFDPEFLALNPDLKYQSPESTPNILNVEGLRSDAAHQLWTWLTTDPGSKAFLDGCADPYGGVINPFYSTRSYAECPKDAGALSSVAADKINHTHSPVGFDQTRPQSYPPTTAFPQVLWYQQDAWPTTDPNPKASWGAATMIDLFPSLASMPALARASFQAALPVPTWCYGTDTPGAPCSSNRDPGEWKGVAAKTPLGSRTVVSLVSTADAARFQLPTARLCDDTGKLCVGADQQSLQTAVSTGFAADAASGMLVPTGTVDYQSGAYPLAMLVYGVVNTKGLAQDQANSLATALEFIANTGQTPGVKLGNLLPGYAPLDASLVAQAVAAVDSLRHLPPPAETNKPPVKQPPVDGLKEGSKSGVEPPTVLAPPPAVENAAADQPTPTNVGASGTTAATEIGFPTMGLVAGLIAAILAAALSQFFGRKKKVSP